MKTMRENGDRHPADGKRPALSNDCLDYYEAFCSLGASRVWSQVGPEPIPTTEIEAELRLMGVDDAHEKMKFKRLMKRLDRAELDYHFAKLKAQRK